MSTSTAYAIHASASVTFVISYYGGFFSRIKKKRYPIHHVGISTDVKCLHACTYALSACNHKLYFLIFSKGYFTMPDMLSVGQGKQTQSQYVTTLVVSFILF